MPQNTFSQDKGTAGRAIFIVVASAICSGIAKENPKGGVAAFLFLVVLTFWIWVGQRMFRRHWIHEQSMQGVRDVRACSVMAHQRSTPVAGASYGLYLRPFETTGQIMVRNPKRPFFDLWPSAALADVYTDLEVLLAEAVELSTPMVCLAPPKSRDGQTLGAGRIHGHDAGWQARFHKLANGASSILLVPLVADHGGTSYEIDWLARTGLLAKTVLMMPPQGKRRRGAWQTSWDASAAVLSEKGLHLPKYSSSGGLFCLGPDGRAQGFEAFSSFKPRRLHRLLQRIWGTAQNQWARSAPQSAASTC